MCQSKSAWFALQNFHTHFGFSSCQCSFYLIKYLAKDGNELANILSLVKAADEQIRRHPSVAEDSGTELRRSQHLITRLLNCVNGQVEIGGQTAALALLGFPSNIVSHGFTFVFIKSAVEHTRAVHERLPPTAVAARSSQTLRETLATLDDEELFVDGDRNDNDDDADEDGVCDVTRSGNAITLVPQHLDYAHRGDKLRKLSLFQWCGIICITDKRRRRESTNRVQTDHESIDNDDVDDNNEIDDVIDTEPTIADAEEGAQATTVRRQMNAQFPFSVAHTARATKTQRLFTKQLVCRSFCGFI